jgi:hypothetical protein
MADLVRRRVAVRPPLGLLSRQKTQQRLFRSFLPSVLIRSSSVWSRAWPGRAATRPGSILLPQR